MKNLSVLSRGKSFDLMKNSRIELKNKQRRDCKEITLKLQTSSGIDMTAFIVQAAEKS